MRGSIGYDKRTRNWWFRHDVAAQGGVRRQVRRRGYGTKKQAEAALAESLWEAGATKQAPPNYTVARYLSLSIEAREKELAPATLERYQRTLTDWVERSTLGGCGIAALDAHTIRQWVDGMTARGLAASTIASAWRVVETHLRPLARSGLLEEAILRRAMPRPGRPPLRVWSPEVTRRALEELRGDALHPLVGVAVTTGLRAGELLALRWDHWQGHGLVVERALTWTSRGPAWKETKTRERRRVDLYPEAEAILEAHRAGQREEPDGLIFPRLSGGPWKPQNLSSQFQLRLKRLGLPRIRWHDLRHTHASHLLAAGVPVTTVSARLGHASPQTTLRTYAHLVPGQQSEAVRLGSAFLGLRAHSCPGGRENGSG